MAVRKITFGLSEADINRAIRELADYKRWIEKKIDEITRRLAEAGIYEASVRFIGALHDTDKTDDTALSIEETERGYKIVADGSQVFFIEFGAGVYFNGTEPYPSPPGRPKGVKGIGEYGDGKGKRDGWFYKGEDEKPYFTRGTPAAMPMYHAGREIEQRVIEIAREVFG